MLFLERHTHIFARYVSHLSPDISTRRQTFSRSINEAHAELFFPACATDGVHKRNRPFCVWECHIQPNWLLVWEIHDQELVLVLLNTGTHSDLFDKKYKKR